MARRIAGSIRGAVALALLAGAAFGQGTTNSYPSDRYPTDPTNPNNGYPGTAYPSDRYPSDPTTAYPNNGIPNNGYPGNGNTDQSGISTDTTGNEGNTDNGNSGFDATGEQEPTQGYTTTQSGPVQTVHPRRQGLPTAAQPPFLLTGLVGLSETYTTNAAGSASGSQGDFDSRLNLGLNALEQTAELTGALSYNGELDVFARSNTRPVISTNITGLLDYNAVPDYLRFDVRIFAQPVLLSPLGSVQTANTPLPQGFNSNVSDTYGYQAAPTVTFRLGSFATSELVPSYGTIWFVRPAGAPPQPLVLAGLAPPSQVSTASVVEKLTSGDDFSRLYWQLTGNYLRQSESAQGLKQAEGTVDLEYAITRRFDVLLMGGYQSIDSNTMLSQSLTGPIAYGGLRVRFSQFSMVELRAGENYNRPSYTGSADIAFSPSTGLSGSLADTIETPAGRLLNNLSDLDVSVQDGGYQFYDSTTALPGQAPTSAFSLTPPDNLSFNNVIERFRTGEFNLYHRFADTTVLSLGGFGTVANILSAVPVNERPRQTSWGATLTASHAVSPDLNVSGFLDWNEQNIGLFGNNDNVGLGVQANYNVSKTLSINGIVQYFDRISSQSLSAAQPVSGSANVLTFTVGITKSF